MEQKLSWSRIREFFRGHWVELVDFEWEWDKPHPTRAKVRHHSSERGELLSKIQKSSEREDSVILFVGNASAVVEHDQSVANL